MKTTKAQKLDLYKKHQSEYIAPRKPTLVDTLPASYLLAEGMGEPGGESFQSKVGALYGMAYTMKFQSKFAGRDYTVGKLEGLWWTRDGNAPSPGMPKDNWCWKLMIRTPDFMGEKERLLAIATLQERGKQGEFSSVRIESLAEGQCVQMLHVGPYDAEHETLAAMAQFAQSQGLTTHGLHHEIYLSDPRRVPPEKLRTILRLPVRHL